MEFRDPVERVMLMLKVIAWISASIAVLLIMMLLSGV